MLHTTLIKIHSLLTPRERRRLLLLFCCMVLNALVEAAGVASILPFMAVVGQPELFSRHQMLASIGTTLGFIDARTFTVFLGGVVLFLVVVGNLFSAFTAVFLIRTGALLNQSLSRRLLAAYLFRPYEQFLQDNSSRLNRNIMVEVYNAIFNVVNPTLLACARLISATCIILLLLFMKPLLSLVVVSVLGSLYPLIFMLVRKIQKWNGERHMLLNRELARIVAEVFGGIKEIKLAGIEEEFLTRFNGPSRKIARHYTVGNAVPQIPRYLMEIIAFGGVILLLIHFLKSGREITAVLPFITLYAVAGYRLMPALQQAFSGFSMARFHLPALDLLCADLQDTSPLRVTHRTSGKPDRLQLCREIRMERVAYRYSGSSIPAVNDLNLTIPACTTVAFVGPSGSGKTTTVDILLGLLTLQEGEVLIDGVSLDYGNFPAWQRNLGYVPQVIFLTDDTITRNIAFGIPDGEIDHVAVERAARSASIHEFIINDLPAGYDTIVGDRGVRLSGGERQRIGIARALYHDPPVLVLDEATSSLDGITEDAILEAIHTLSHKKTIIMIAHRFTTIMDCDRIFFMDEGRVVSQVSYHELLESSQQFREMAKLKG